MRQTPIGIILNGVTGRMGTNQHYLRSILAIMKQGGVRLPDGSSLMPDPILVGRSEDRLQALLARAPELPIRCTTDLQSALADPRYTIYFDAQTTGRRCEAVKRAVAGRQARLLRKAHRHQPCRGV